MGALLFPLWTDLPNNEHLFPGLLMPVVYAIVNIELVCKLMQRIH